MAVHYLAFRLQSSMKGICRFGKCYKHVLDVDWCTSLTFRQRPHASRSDDPGRLRPGNAHNFQEVGAEDDASLTETLLGSAEPALAWLASRDEVGERHPTHGTHLLCPILVHGQGFSRFNPTAHLAVNHPHGVQEDSNMPNPFT